MTVWCLKRKARRLMHGWIVRRESYSCGNELLKFICPRAWYNYRKGLAYARLARLKERK